MIIITSAADQGQHIEQEMKDEAAERRVHLRGWTFTFSKIKTVSDENVA